MCFRVVSPKCAATKQNMSPPYALGDVKLFDPLRRATLSSFLLHFLKGHGSFGPFLHDFTPPPETKRRERRWCSAARCSPLLPQAVIAAALTVQLPSPASYCVTLLFGRPPPRWFIGHTGEALLDPSRGVCAYVCVCVVYACHWETGCCRHSPTAPPPISAPHCEMSLLWLAEEQPLQTGECQTLLFHLFCRSLSNLPATVERKDRALEDTVRKEELQKHPQIQLLSEPRDLWVFFSAFQGFKSIENELICSYSSLNFNSLVSWTLPTFACTALLASVPAGQVTTPQAL